MERQQHQHHRRQQRQRHQPLRDGIDHIRLIKLLCFYTISLLIVALCQYSINICSTVQALPSGAAACDEGTASANYGFHIDSESGRIIDKGLLSKFNTSLTIQNVSIPEFRPANGNVSATISLEYPGNTPLSFTVRSGRYQNETLPIRGILVRIQADDDVPFLISNYNTDLLQDAGYVCDASPKNVFGITHRTRTAKNNVTGTVQFDANGVVLFDITVVYMNGRVAPGDKSIFGFTRYNITIVNSSSVPTPNSLPVPVPVTRPPPTKAPVVDKCANNTCRTFFGLLPGRLYNRFRGGRCETRCNALINFFVLPQFGWQCGGCF